MSSAPYDYQKKFFSPRLLDYVLIVGTRHPNRNDSVVQTPELLRRYPHEDHRDFPLPPDVVFFCQPEGCVSVGPRRLTLRDSSSFVFALTEKDSGRTRYGICVNFYRPFERRQQHSGSASIGGGNRAGSRSSTGGRAERRRLQRGEATATDSGATPAAGYVAGNSSSNSIGGPLSTSSPLLQPDAAASTGLPRPAGGGGGDSSPGGSSSKSRRSSSSRRRHRRAAGASGGNRIKNNTLTSLCIVSHHPFFSTFRDCLNVLRRLIDACTERASASMTGRRSVGSGTGGTAGSRSSGFR